MNFDYDQKSIIKLNLPESKAIKRKGVIIIPIYIKKVKIKAFVKILCVVYLILADSLTNSIISIQ